MFFLWILFLLLSGSREALAQTSSPAATDALFARLLAAIRQIQIIDNHAHPGLPGDLEREVLSFTPAGGMPQEIPTLPSRLRPNNVELIPAFHALYGYTHSDLSLEHLRELAALKKKKRASADASYFNTVLDEAGISISLANRVGMVNAPLDRQRFKWVPSVDAYLFPLNNSVYKKQHPIFEDFFSSEEKVLERYFTLVETARPRRFDAYLRFVHESVSRLKADGAIAVKFERVCVGNDKFRANQLTRDPGVGNQNAGLTFELLAQDEGFSIYRQAPEAFSRHNCQWRRHAVAQHGL